jgi:hypothetical protein
MLGSLRLVRGSATAAARPRTRADQMEHSSQDRVWRILNVIKVENCYLVTLLP